MINLCQKSIILKAVLCFKGAKYWKKFIEYCKSCYGLQSISKLRKRDRNLAQDDFFKIDCDIIWDVSLVYVTVNNRDYGIKCFH